MNHKTALCCFIIITAITLTTLLPAYAATKPKGTSIEATITAKGFLEHYKTYDWTLTKTMQPNEIQLKQGETGDIETVIIATRQPAIESKVYGVSGTVSVSNGGAVATENLQITVTVQYKVGNGKFKDLADASTTITIPSQLQPSKTATYQYSIQYTPVANAKYRVIAYITITNHSGHIGEAYGPEPKADFTLPSSPTAYVNIDASAKLTDEITCPEGFSYTTSTTGPWHLTDTTTIHYTTELTNNAAQSTVIYSLENTATLTEETTLQQRTANANVIVHPPMFQVPEYWMGGLGALVALIAAFTVFKLAKKTPSTQFSHGAKTLACQRSELL